jgi:SAM-dependent methyltransferase
MTGRHPAWWHICPACGMQAATLVPAFDGRSIDAVFDRRQREAALAALRTANARRILKRLADVLPPPATLLDVGCAEGWFIAQAQAFGYDAYGLEADARMTAREQQSKVRVGFFPQALAQDERFDIITFNDVFEHLPDVRAAMRACHHHLSERGVLVINCPDARGGIYRLAQVLARLGVTGPFRRLWQEGYPSPHLTYFTHDTLRRLAEAHGFREYASFPLPALELGGTWARLRFDRTRSLAYSTVAFAAAVAAWPLLAVLRSDVSAQIFAKRPAD